MDDGFVVLFLLWLIDGFLYMGCNAINIKCIDMYVLNDQNVIDKRQIIRK